MRKRKKKKKEKEKKLCVCERRSGFVSQKRLVIHECRRCGGTYSYIVAAVPIRGRFRDRRHRKHITIKHHRSHIIM